MKLQTSTNLETSTAVNSATTLYAFSTDLGWMGVLWDGARVLRNVFGHADLGAVQSSVAAEFSDDEFGRSIDVKTSLRGDRLRKIVQLLRAYSSGKSIDFSAVSLNIDHLTTFQFRVIECCREIPYGETQSYGQLALAAGSPRAARAVGTVMRSNRFPLIVPCHRVVASGGLGGYSAPDGLDMKRRLLKMEQPS
jgi:methylated-DNA-[protein]-cysteine S-methyltransferase